MLTTDTEDILRARVGSEHLWTGPVSLQPGENGAIAGRSCQCLPLDILPSVIVWPLLKKPLLDADTQASWERSLNGWFPASSFVSHHDSYGQLRATSCKLRAPSMLCLAKMCGRSSLDVVLMLWSSLPLEGGQSLSLDFFKKCYKFFLLGHEFSKKD